MLHGSYAKNENRIDSDIDLIVELSEDLAYNKRLNIVSQLKDKYEKEFKRFVDIQEVSRILSEEYIKEIKTILIFQEEEEDE